MRYSRLISPSLSLSFFTPISRNLNGLESYQPVLTRSCLAYYSTYSSHVFRNSYLITRNFESSHNASSVRQCSSSAQASKPVRSKEALEIADELSGLTMLEMMDLVEVLRKKAGVEMMPSMVVMMPGMSFSGMKGGAKGGGAAKDEEKKVEKTAFDLKLEGGFDAGSKIKIIKEVRACTSLGLKEAKDLVEKAPTLLKKGVPKEEAEQIIQKLKDAGATVTME